MRDKKGIKKLPWKIAKRYEEIFGSPDTVSNILVRRWLYASLELSQIEKQIIQLRFIDRATLAEIGDVLGITREAVRQREERVLNKIRKAKEAL